MRSDLMSFFRRPGILPLVFLCLFMAQTAFTLPFQAEEEAKSRIAAISRPNPEGVPTKVELGGYLMDLSAVDDVDQTFWVDLYLWFAWNDPRLALKDVDATGEPRSFSFQEIWHPFLDIFNQRSLSTRYDEVLIVDAEGNVQFTQRYQGELSTPLHHKNFPFDSHVICGSLEKVIDNLFLNLFRAADVDSNYRNIAVGSVETCQQAG
ncbi:MAG: hypothetical protein ACERK6_09600, partial [Candidatus Aminicenantaceae bacterium]